MSIPGPRFGRREGLSLGPFTYMHLLASEDLLEASGSNEVDIFSYHFYGAVSKRCSSGSLGTTTTPYAELTKNISPAPTKHIGSIQGFVITMHPRSRFGLPETAQAAYGRDSWAATFRVSFRYLDQTGWMAQKGVQLIARNILAASDYSLMDEDTLKPRPNYWSALLWRKLMGTRVLDPGSRGGQTMHLYADCLLGSPVGVALLVMNPDRPAKHYLESGAPSIRYSLTGQTVENTTVDVNGTEPALGPEDELPKLVGKPVTKGRLSMDEASITFLAIPTAKNQACC